MAWLFCVLGCNSCPFCSLIIQGSEGTWDNAFLKAYIQIVAKGRGRAVEEGGNVFSDERENHRDDWSVGQGWSMAGRNMGSGKIHLLQLGAGKAQLGTGKALRWVWRADQSLSHLIYKTP